jgi:hypothetical protein
MTVQSRYGVISFILASLMTLPAQAQEAPSVRYTTAGWKLPQCQQASAPVEGFSCKGLAGWSLNVGYPAFGATVSFDHDKSMRPANSPADGRQIYIDDIAGNTSTIEWRGTMRGRAFEPYAAIIRVLVLDAAQRQEMIEQGVLLPLAKRAQILVVTRLGREGACVVAYVDAQANSKPNEMARDAADTLGRSTTCPVASVDIVGTKTSVLTSYMK